MKILYLLKSFLIFYPNIFYDIKYELYNSNIYGSLGKFWVTNCFFSNFNSINSVIYSTNFLYSLIENSIFQLCYNINSGAIYLSSDGNSILNNLCLYKCISSSNNWPGNQNFLIETTSNLNRNEIYFVTITYSINENFRGAATLKMGNQYIQNFNTSNHYLYYETGCEFYSSYLTNIIHSIFFNNTGKYSICFRITYCNNINNKFEFSNIIFNNDNVINYGYVFIYSSNLNLNNCSLLYNNLNNNQNLFDGSVIVKNCFLPQNFNYFGATIINPIKTNLLLNINQLNTFKCNFHFKYFSIKYLKKIKFNTFLIFIFQ